jgi:hypothetical protein
VDEKSLIDDLWPALEPSRDFSARVLGALDGVATRAAPRRSRSIWAVAAVAGVVVLVPSSAHLLTRGRPAPHATFGDVAARERQTVTIADRAVAVAEAGTDLSWTSSAGLVRVNQRHGAVFYRVDHGGPFVVSTAAAEIRVTGTCFQVSLDGGVAVHVLEGSVSVSNARGSLSLSAGERARVEVGGLPAAVQAPDDGELLARNRDRVQQLERALRDARRAPSEPAAPGTLGENKFLDFSPDDLKVLGARCEFRYARHQHLIGFGPPDLGGRVTLDERERSAVLQIMEDQRTHFIEELRGIYLEIVGDRTAAANLSPVALIDEINAKSRPGEDAEARDHLFDEWAGRATPPANLAARPPVERFWRLVFGASEVFIRRLTEVVGPERARAIARSTVHDRVQIGGPCGRFKPH